MLPPSIPTSFVPHTASAAARTFRADWSGAFAFLGYGILAIIFALAVGVFFYGRILSASQAAKDAELAKAEAAIDPATVESFVALRNRLNSGQTLLNNHVALSSFFTLLQTIGPTTVRFSSMHLVLDGTGVAKLEGAGVAKSFNALAAASSALAADGRIKDAIFSRIVVSSKDGSVAFALAAKLDSKLVAFSVTANAPVVPVQTTAPISGPTEPTTSI